MKPILRADFQNRTAIPNGLLCPAWQDAERVVSLREVVKVRSVADMSNEYLIQLTNAVPLVGDPNHFPYRDCKIKLVDADTRHTSVGQTFVQSDKVIGILTSFFYLFRDFSACRRIAELTAKIILGEDKNGELVIAHYLPSIIEEHGSAQAALDGIHRQFITRGIGTNLAGVAFCNVKTPFPTSLHHWREVRVVGEKPPKEERFFDLQPELFRDLKAVGIDG